MAGEELHLRQSLVTDKGSLTQHRQVCQETRTVHQERATAPLNVTAWPQLPPHAQPESGAVLTLQPSPASAAPQESQLVLVGQRPSESQVLCQATKFWGDVSCSRR